MKTKMKLLLLTLAMVFAMTIGSAGAATMSASSTAPTVNGEDIANYGTATGSDKWWPGSADAYGNPGKTVGQTFTTGDTGAIFNAVTFKINSATQPTKGYTIRVGTISDTTFTEIYSETATQSVSTSANNYWTWTLNTPVTLAANTVYGVDVGLNYSTSEWTTGIPYVYYTADVYADGTRFRSGTAGDGIGDTTMTQVSGDRIFHMDMDVTPEADLIAALIELKDHIEGTITLSTAEIAAHKATIDSDKQYMGNSAAVIAASFDLVEAYDTTSGFGPLWVNVQPPARNLLSDDLVSTMYWVQQYIIDYIYTAANVVQYEALLDGFKMDCSAVFPGSVAPPSIVTHTATIDASYPDTLGWLRQGDDAPARKPTGTYLAPGTIVTVTVPSALVNSGYQIRVGAQSWDNTNRTPNKRLARCSIVYDITAQQTDVANPLGGGIYIEVPYESNNGIVEVDVTGAVRSPYYSAKSFDTTTLSEWQNVERNHPAPWADFQTEKYMCQVPTNYIYALNDPAPGLADWDDAIDTMNDLMGFPRDRGKETVYAQIDQINRSSVFAPGYPSVNTSDSAPTTGSNGDSTSYLIRGPNTNIYISGVEIHEQGHAYFFDKFAGEMESTVNLPYVAIMNQTFAHDLDYSLAASLNFHGNPYRTLDNTAIAWMCSFNFSPRYVEMASAEAAYQLKGHAKFVDIARLFGWEVLNDYYYQLVLEDKNKNNSGLSDDDRILRLSIAAGVDLRPLLHFWGKHPENPSALATAIAAEDLPASPEIYDALVHYRSILPANNSAFQTYALNWWGHWPSVNAAWTEVEHGRQMDTTSYWQDRGWDYMGTDPAQADGEIYTEAMRARTQAYIDTIIDLYFPADAIHEMENGTMSGAVISTAHAGYTGTGFADYTTSTGYVELTVNVPTDGTYDISYRYALASGNRPLEIKVNGQVVASSLSFPATGAWTTWGYTATVPVTLNAGNNTVRATGIGYSGANVDHLLVEWR